jgi:hypothetical protein
VPSSTASIAAIVPPAERSAISNDPAVGVGERLYVADVGAGVEPADLVDGRVAGLDVDEARE